MSANQRSVRNRILILSLITVVTGVVCYFAFRRQVVSSLHEIGALPKGYDGWLAHVEAKISESPEEVEGDGSSCYFCFLIEVDWDEARSSAMLNDKAMSNFELAAALGPQRGSAILLRMPLSAKHRDVDSLAKALVDAGLGDHVYPALEGEQFKRIHSVKLGGRFLRAIVFDKPREPIRRHVASLHEIGALPKGYDGWLAHVEAELLAAGEERPEDPLYPPGLIRTPIIVDLNASGRILLNNTEFSLPGLISILKRTFEGQSEPDPITFRAADDVRVEAVDTVAREFVAAGFGGNTRPHLEGKKFSRVYSLKLGGRFMRVTVSGAEE